MNADRRKALSEIQARIQALKADAEALHMLS